MFECDSHRMSFPLTALIIGIVILFSQNTIPFTHTSHNIVRNVPTTETFDEIDLANLIILKDSPYTVCIDIREKNFYDYAHILGAVNLPAELFLSDLPQKLLAKSKKISNTIIYCNSNSSDLSQNIAHKLSKLGFRGIKIYSAGWEQWKACKLPVESNNE